MNKKAHFYVNYNNMVVLSGYLDVIRSALVESGFECDDVTDIRNLDKQDLYIFPMGIDAFKFYLKGYRNYILWQQGATADESYMRNHSRIRYHILNLIDCYSMKKAKFVLFCSEYMRQHYEKLSKCSFETKSYLMPCYNEKLNIEAIKEKDYSKMTFAYVGSLDLWQCFDGIAELYKKIETIYPQAFFKVLTFSVEEAKKTVKKLEIKNYEVKCVSKEQVQQELKDVVYGFIIRKDSVVNKVATPTKISSYLSVGIIPIFSDVLDDFYKRSKTMTYAVPVHDNEDMKSIITRISSPIEKEGLLQEYKELFATYYGTDYHIANISQKVKELCCHERK